MHSIEFATNRQGLARALCSCGWVKFGPLAECQAAAASHDIDEWQAVEVTAQPAGDAHA